MTQENIEVKASEKIAGTSFTVYYLTCGTVEVKEGKRLIWHGTVKIFQSMQRGGLKVA